MKTFLIGLIGLVAWSSGLAFPVIGPLPQNGPTFQLALTNQSTTAIGPAFESSFPKFQVQNPEIVWTARSNYSRAPLWIYKKSSQSYSGIIISNLMRLGSLTMEDQQKWTGEILATNTKTLLFVNESNTCNLLIVPSEGRIEYWDGFAEANHWDKVKHLHEPIEGLPSEAKVRKLGLKYLKQFGIQQTDLAQNTKGHLITFGEKETRSYFDRKRGKYIDDEVIERGIFFNRRMDGVNFAGIGLGGGCEITFGNHAKIARIKLVWPNLQPYEHRQVANQDEIMQRIRDGQAVLTHKNLVNPADVKKLTIADCSPLYMGEDGEKAQNFVYPFAQLEAVADLGSTNVSMQLYCPILSSNTIKP